MIKKYQEFYNQIFESGLRDIKNILKNYPSKEFEIYFHQDLDGVTSALAMKGYLDRYQFKCADSHIIQYGGIEFSVKKTKDGRMSVLCDFAHGKPMFTIQTDHHQGQAGTEDTEATHFKHSRSNVETISGEISPTDVFTAIDIKLINTIDSADFVAHNLKPEDISNSVFGIKKELTGEDNRFAMGLVTNRLLLAYKNKKINGTSLDGKREYRDRNFLECLVLDSTASLISMYTNIKHYVNTFTTKPTRMSPDGKLATPETLAQNLEDYQTTMKTYKYLVVDEKYGIATQYGGGRMFLPGSYDRYTVFKNNPNLNFYSIAWPMGLVQVAANPFKEKELDVDLGGIATELMDIYKPVFKKVWIDILSVKKVAEMDVSKMAEKGEDISKNIGFKATDLEAFYNDKMYHVVDGKIVPYTLTDDVKAIMDKPVGDLTDQESWELKKYKISWYDLITENSGGHKSITNLSSWNYFSYAHPRLKDYVGEYFKLQKRPNKEGNMTYKYTDVMKVVQQHFLHLLKKKIDVHKGAEVKQAELQENLLTKYGKFISEIRYWYGDDRVDDYIEEAKFSWEHGSKRWRFEMLKEVDPEFTEDRTEFSWEDLDNETKEKIIKNLSNGSVNEGVEVDGMQIKVGDKLLVSDGKDKSEVEVLGECEKVEGKKDIDCKVKVKLNGKEVYAYHKEDGDWYHQK